MAGKSKEKNACVGPSKGAEQKPFLTRMLLLSWLCILLLLLIGVIAVFLAMPIERSTALLKLSLIPVIIGFVAITFIFIGVWFVSKPGLAGEKNKSRLLGFLKRAWLPVLLMGIFILLFMVLRPVRITYYQLIGTDDVLNHYSRSLFDRLPVQDYGDYQFLSAERHAVRRYYALPANVSPPTQENFLDFWYMPFNWSDGQLKPLDVYNPLFDIDNNSNGWPDGWVAWGSAEYTDDGCLEGKCLHVLVDDSPGGFLALNSRPIPVEEYHNYTFSFDINCIECSNNSAYMDVVWLENLSNQELTRGRHILYFHKTSGYEKFTISVQATRKSIAAIVGVRVHVEKAFPEKMTTLYIDG